MTSDAETQRLLGELNANVKTLMDRTQKMQEQLDGVVAMTNRWKGATTLLIAIGGLVGWMMNFLFKGHA